MSVKEVEDKHGTENVKIQAIEQKNNDNFVIRLEISDNINKAKIKSYTTQSYKTKLEILEAEYRVKLGVKDEQIAIYRQHNANLGNIIKALGNRPISIENIEINFEAPVTNAKGKN